MRNRHTLCACCEFFMIFHNFMFIRNHQNLTTGDVLRLPTELSVTSAPNSSSSSLLFGVSSSLSELRSYIMFELFP